jgi:hypothetical protein
LFPWLKSISNIFDDIKDILNRFEDIINDSGDIQDVLITSMAPFRADGTVSRKVIIILRVGIRGISDTENSRQSFSVKVGR